MRLLHTTSFQFKEFFDSQVPKYAILSHRWDDAEVSFQEFEQALRKQSAALDKVLQCCRLARFRGLDWAWVDTCCIDKTSSAELSEAINSIYRWYENSEVCYAYLSDVLWKPTADPDVSSSRMSFGNSVWFKRGWTLQELLAPSDLVFFDHQWEFIGTKSTMSALISAATRINISFLSSSNASQRATVATKMSWASTRETTRVEDMAYCLIGIFDVNMPLLYGEGRKAFYRLQLEIINNSDDESIFAWMADPGRITGMLAPWPSSFISSADIVPSYASTKSDERQPYRMTNRGLEFHLPRVVHYLSQQNLTDADYQILMPTCMIEFNLNCATGRGMFISIRLIKIVGIWYRIERDDSSPTYSTPGYIDNKGKARLKIIYIRNSGDLRLPS
ncbi:hypothetical protein MMC11_002331 [Xylographa trunciseda]|nr:hypothetical protein [Xylographa trunciseda]